MIALYTIESKYQILSNGIKEIIWIIILMKKLKQDMEEATILYDNN